MSLTFRLFALPAPGGFVLAWRGAVKVWTRAAEALLGEHLHAAAADHPRAEGFTEIVLTLDEDGVLKAAQLEKSSGHSALDDLWLKALEAVSSLPAPPSVVLESQIVLQLEFVRADQVA